MNRKFYFTPTDNYHANMRRMVEALGTGRFLIEEVSRNVFTITDTENNSRITLDARGTERLNIESLLVQAMQKKMFPESIPDYELDAKSGLALMKPQ